VRFNFTIAQYIFLIAVSSRRRPLWEDGFALFPEGALRRSLWKIPPYLPFFRKKKNIFNWKIIPGDPKLRD